jgi:hypothetical protein
MDSLCPTASATIGRINIETRKKRSDPFMLDIQIRAATDQAICIPIKCNGPAAVPDNLSPHHQTRRTGQLSVPHAMRVASANYWLKLGEADEALRELEALPGRAWDDLAAVDVRVDAVRILDGRAGSIGQCQGTANSLLQGNSQV